MKDLYLEKADMNLSALNTEIIVPKIPCETMKNGDEITVDLGNHYVGYFSFRLECAAAYIDAPVRLYIQFFEMANELEYDFSTYKGTLCKSWIQDEIINIDYPGEHRMQRRYSARYIKIKILATPKDVVLSDFKMEAVTSADVKQLKNLHCCDSELKKIDLVAVNTLKNCMQRVFEDGPKRDRRLWSGDLRLEALTDYYTFNNLSLVRRCLYLFAAADTNDRGFIPGYIYENPKYVSGTWFVEDYALLFVASVCDYYIHSEDNETFECLYPVVKQQMDSMHMTLDSDGIVTIPGGCDAFIDWCGGLKKITSLHGIYLYVLNSLVKVLDAVNSKDKGIYLNRYNDAKASAGKVLYSNEKQAFINRKDDYQYSVHSAAWMVLGGAVEGKEAKRVLLDALESSDSLKPFTPYMHHYVAEAMVKLGADTFYEVYKPDDLDFSPYGDKKINSMCHAWSCTPAYFIRKYFN